MSDETDVQKSFRIIREALQSGQWEAMAEAKKELGKLENEFKLVLADNQELEGFVQ